MIDYRNEIDKRFQEIFGLKGYLSSTDYQRLRELDGGDPMKEDVRLKRAKARERINELEAEIVSLEYEKEKVEAEAESEMLVVD